MYVTTFYSFKGGVGRSMALANAAIELATRGRRVLTVDFDLEAPGLDTFDVLRPRHPVPGIIDFVHEYLASNRAPDASGFLARLPAVGDRGGEMWIMPSGAQQATYSANFNQIDWAELYDKRDGYLLFEDLKAQWRQIVNPEYVLIDSRTGHTDTGGICTRQLPDAVAIIFFPNEQNLRGLTKVVQDIRSEARKPRRKAIELHFIMSNVPDLDDEDKILEKKIQAFRNQLAFDRELIVHRYDSLSLLNQAVFTRDRPKSRLASQYRGIVREIVRRNLNDRDGALDYLTRTAVAWRLDGEAGEYPPAAHSPVSVVTEDKLQRIQKVHSGDGEVLFAVGKYRENHPWVKPDPSLYDRAIESGYERPEVYLARARLRSLGGDPSGASEDTMRVLQEDDVPSELFWEAIRLVSPDRSDDAAASPAVMSFDVDGRLGLASDLASLTGENAVSMSILKQIAGDTTTSDAQRARARRQLARGLIAAGACSEAAKLLRHADRSIETMDFDEAFDYGMAMWGARDEIVPDPFLRAVARYSEVYESEPELESEQAPEYLMCMAVACSATGDTVAATKFAKRARQAVDDPEFSCWRYCEVPPSEFTRDIDDIQALIDGDTDRVPWFMRSRSASDTRA